MGNDKFRAFHPDDLAVVRTGRENAEAAIAANDPAHAQKWLGFVLDNIDDLPTRAQRLEYAHWGINQSRSGQFP